MSAQPRTSPGDAAGTVATASEERRFRVFRFKRGDERPHYETFDVPTIARTTVLEALRWIQIHRDRTLALRHSCLHASCGTCGIRVNGREALACVASVRDLGREITVEPIANLPVLTDLVVDMREFVTRFPEEHPLVRESEFVQQAEPPEGIDAFERYVGPAALAWAERVTEEPRGADVANLLAWADDPDGVWRCHAIFECTAACPSNVNPAARIMLLRGTLLGRQLRAQRREERTT